MNLQPRMEMLIEKKVVGLHTKMSFVNNKTRELWQSFMPRRKEILNNFNTDLYSLEIYSRSFFDHFNPAADFQK